MIGRAKNYEKVNQANERLGRLSISYLEKSYIKEAYGRSMKKCVETVLEATTPRPPSGDHRTSI